MAISATLKAFLSKHKIRYTTHTHQTAYTAQEIAAAQHVSGRHLAKCVVVNTNKGCFLTVLPATHLIDFRKLKTALNVNKVSLASEGDIKRLFPDVEVGAMSVFGTLYNIPTVVDKALAQSEEIVCNAGSHTDTMTIRYRDFEQAVKPKVGAFGLQAGGPKPAPKRKPSAKSKTKKRPVRPAKSRRK